jgi:hypothetical protein
VTGHGEAVTRILGSITRTRVDPLAVTASAVAVAMVLAYLEVVRQQDGDPAAWAVAALLLGGGAASYGAVWRSPYRRTPLVAAGVVLLGVGLLAILSIGLPIMVAGALCLVAAGRRPVVPVGGP